jgi:2-(1,2-epoxy-1,2-dihydrophenyl)acetyl-CoA isomerase
LAIAGEQLLSVESVLGAMPAAALGATLVGERILVAPSGSGYWQRGQDDRDALLGRAVAALAAARETGVDAIVDVTTIEGGRDVALLRDAAEASGVAVVCATGLDAEADGVSAAFRSLTAAQLADVFVGELLIGIPGSGIRAGAITVAAGAVPTAFDDRAALAAAFAHADTGAPVLARAPGERLVALVDGLVGRGVDPERIVALDLDSAHVGWAVLEELGKRGVGLAFTCADDSAIDDDARAALVAYALRRYGAGRVALATGAVACRVAVPGAEPADDGAATRRLAALRARLESFGASKGILAETLRGAPGPLFAPLRESGGDERILVERDERVCKLTLNRPDVLNAMTAADLRRLTRELLRLWRDDEVGAVLVTGAGRAFTAGHDLTGGDLGAVGAGAWNDLFNVMWDFPKPTVSALNGTAVGGGLHLALACDIALCRDEAMVGESFVWIGACPDTGGHIYLQRSIGHQRAVELLTMGRKLNAKELADAGLFVSSWPTNEALLEEAMRMARQLSTGPRVSYKVTRSGLEFARLHGTAEVLAWEAEQEELMTKTHDMQEGVAAFLEKRPPAFRGN